MATRSRIAIETSDDQGNKVIKSIYCHFDGYIDHNGKILQEFYTSESKVKSLIELGDISILAKEVSTNESHDFGNPKKGVVVAYHRDRGEDLSPPRENSSVSEFFKSDIEEYGYLFTEEGEWLVKGYGHGDPLPLKYVIEKRARVQ